MYTNQGRLSAERPTGHELSRTSSASSDRASPIRPPRSDRRRSSASPEPSMASIPTSPTSPIGSRQQQSMSGLSVVTSSPLATIRAGSTPVSPRAASTPPPLPSPHFSMSSFEPSQDMYRPTSSASSSSQVSGIAPSAMPTSPLATFTAGLPHTSSPGLGPLKIESTTGSKATVIKEPKRKGKSRSSSRASSAYSGGISSEDVFGKSSDKHDSDTHSNTSSRPSKSGRKKSIGAATFGWKGKQPERGISSTDTFPPELQNTRERSSPSLANMLQGLRRGDSAPGSPAQSGRSNSSRSSSRASGLQSSGPSDASESESMALSQGRVRRSSSGRARLVNAFKRKTSLEREEDEEHLRVLADLRLRALALASADDDDGTSKQQRENAELLVKGMQDIRTSAIPLNRQATSSTESSRYSQRASSRHRVDGEDNVDLHIRSPSRGSMQSGDLSPTQQLSPSIYSTGSEAGLEKLQPTFPAAGNSVRNDSSEDEGNDTSIVSESRRRSTIVPGSSSHSSLSGLDRMPTTSTSVPAASGRRTSGGLWLTRDSFDGKAIPDVPDSGDEADQEAEVDSELLERRRSTIRPTQTSPVPALSGSRRGTLQDLPALAENADALQISDGLGGEAYSVHTRSYTPPIRTTSRPISPDSGRPVSPLKFRSGSYFNTPASPPPLSPSGSGDVTFTLGRTREVSVSSRHAREGAAGSEILDMIPDEQGHAERRPSGKIVDELNQAINAAMYDTRRSPPSPKTTKLQISPTQAFRDLPDTAGAQDKANVSPKSFRTPSLASLRLHRRTSSGTPTSPIHRQASHHRRTSSDDHIVKAMAPPPLHRRGSSVTSMRSIARGAGQARLPSHAESRPLLDVEKARALLVRNRPLPKAAQVKEEIRRCRSTGERAIVYAEKINELALCESGLEIWIVALQQRSLAHPGTQTYLPGGRKASNATFTSSVRPSSPPFIAGHANRDDSMSEAPFPLRKGSQDVYRARDITQRAPSIAPSSMVPSTIPYPGVYDNSQTLRTSSALSHNSGSTTRQQGSFASAALNAAGLPSRVGFFGLGRKGSKRAPSTNYPKHRAGVDSNASTSGLSISGPVQMPPPGQLPPSIGRANALRPSGPRPSISSSSDMPSFASSSSIYSLAAPQFPAVSPPALGTQNIALPASATYSKAVNTDQELLTSMADILPLASRDDLAKYLRLCNGDHLAAIGRYLDDERAGKL